MRHVYICDPQLHSQGGHYLNHDAQLLRELHRRQLPTTLFARRGCTVTCEGVTPEGIFSHDIFQEAASDPQVWAIENFHNINQAFLADLCRIDVARLAADDLVYFPNLLQNQLYAVAMWLGRIPADRRPAVAVMLRYLNHAMDYVQTRANKDLVALYYRYSARALLAVQPRSLLCADTLELATAYRQITGFPVLELPNPMDVSGLLTGSATRAADPRPTVVYQGHTSGLRGLHFLPEIIERCAKLQPQPRFLVQVQSREAAASSQLGPTVARLDALAGDQVRIVNGALSASDYFAMLNEADIVLLPYSPTFYGHGSSGVFTEAASLGKVIVASPGTVPARQGREFGLGVVTATAWTPAAMAEAVATALKQLPALRQKAAISAPRFRSEQCARVLWDRVFTALSAAKVVPAAAAAA